MDFALNLINNIKTTMWNGLDSIEFPVLGVSMLIVFIAVLFINCVIWFISVLTGGRQNDSKSFGSGLDNNNNYIYRR